MQDSCHKEERLPRQSKKRKSEVDTGDLSAMSELPSASEVDKMKRRIIELEHQLIQEREREREARSEAHAGEENGQKPPAQTNGVAARRDKPTVVRRHKLEGTAAFLDEYLARDATTFVPIVVAEPGQKEGLTGEDLAESKVKGQTGEQREKLIVAFMDEYGGARLKERPNAYWERHDNREKRTQLVEGLRTALDELGEEVRRDVVGDVLVS